MITRNLAQRVLMLRCGSQVGTAFTFEVDDRQYLFTAAHVVDELEPAGGAIEIHDQGVASTVEIARWWKHPQPTVDIAVLAPPHQLTPALRIHVAIEGVAWGQDAYFIGYPYGTRPVGHSEEGTWWCPAFARKAIISAFERPKEVSYLSYVLDGHAAQGFSGGPVALKLLNEPQEPLRVAAILTSFRTMPHPVAYGEREFGSVNVQSGHVIAHNIQYALDGARILGCGVSVTVID